MLSEYQKKWIQAIANLIRLTQEKELKWQAKPPPLRLTEDNPRADIMYVTDFEGQELCLYERYFFDHDFFHSPETVLELSNSDGHAAWASPKIEGLDDLLEAVKYQVIDVNDFLEKILKKK